MARTETLKLLGGIVTNLGALEEVDRGTPLRSDDWNTVIEAVSSLAKLVTSREQTLDDQLEEGFAPIGHEHRGAATFSWFEPTTRRLLETASGGSADLRIGQKSIEKNINGLRGDLKEMRADMDALRLSLDELRDADFARARSIGRVENDVELLRGLESGVDNLSDRLTGLDGDISTVLTFRDELQSDDGVVDLGALQDRVGSLEEMRENLLTADGEIVRIQELESTLARLEQDVIGRDEIDGLIVDRFGDADLLNDAGLLAGIATQVEATLDPRISSAENGVNDLRGDLTSLGDEVAPLGNRLDGIDSELAKHEAGLTGVASLAPRVNQAETRLTAAEAGLSNATNALGQLDELDSKVSGLGNRIDGLDATVKLAATNAASINGLSTRADALEITTAEFEKLPGRVDTLEVQTVAIDSLGSRVTAIELDTVSVNGRLDLADAEFKTLAGTTERLTKLEGQTDNFNEWKLSTDKRIDEIGKGSSGVVRERLSVLEEGLADQGAQIRKLDQEVRPILRGNTRVTTRNVVLGGQGRPNS